jgi:hypothetical protein
VVIFWLFVGGIDYFIVWSHIRFPRMKQHLSYILVPMWKTTVVTVWPSYSMISVLRLHYSATGDLSLFFVGDMFTAVSW